MSINDKRWSVGKNDIDRDNRLLNRSSQQGAYMPSDDPKKAYFSKKTFFSKVLAIMCGVLSFVLFYLIGRLLPEKWNNNLLFLFIALAISWCVYKLVGNLIMKQGHRKGK